MSERSAPPTKVLHRGRRRGEYEQEIQSAGGGATISDLLPTRDEKDALAGTSGHPAQGNKYVTHADSRLSDQRDAKSLQGRTVDSAAPNDGDVLKWIAATTRWAPGTGGGGAGGGGTGGAVWEQIWKALDGNTDPVDTLLTLGPYRVFVFFSSQNAVAWKAATNAVYTVPTGKKLIVLTKQSSEDVAEDTANRQARFRNVTDGTDVLAPVEFQGTGAGFLPWKGDGATASKLTEVAAGKQIRLEIWNVDAITKRAAGAIVICREVPSAGGSPTGELALGFKTRNLRITNDAVAPLNKVTVTADEISVEDVVFGSITQSADLTVAGAGGLDTGAEAANTWYAVWLIYNPSTDALAAMLSTSFTAPTMPTGYTKKRRMGAVRNDNSSNFIKFRQLGDIVDYTDVAYDANHHRMLSAGAATVFTTVACAVIVPPSSQRAFARVNRDGTDTTGYTKFRITGSGATEGTPNLGGATNVAMWLFISLNGSQQFDYMHSIANRGLYVDILGYFDPVL